MNNCQDLGDRNKIKTFDIYDMASSHFNIDIEIIKKYDVKHKLSLFDIIQFPDELKKDIIIFHRREKIENIKSRTKTHL